MSIPDSLNTMIFDAVKHVRAKNSSTDPNALAKHRKDVEFLSRLATPLAGITTKALTLGGRLCEYTSPNLGHRHDCIILYCHGGGFISGDLKYAGILAAKLALHTGLGVITYAYSLAPEHPYPAQLNQTEDVYNALLHQGWGSKQIILAGDSAGGNLVLELCIRLKRQKRFQPKALLLFSPWTDMRCVSETIKDLKDQDPILSPETLYIARVAYAGQDADFHSPEFSPILADLSDMPPMLIQVGTKEILLDDSRLLETAVKKAGGFATLQVFDDAWHVFQQLPTPTASRALNAVSEWLSAKIL